MSCTWVKESHPETSSAAVSSVNGSPWWGKTAFTASYTASLACMSGVLSGGPRCQLAPKVPKPVLRARYFPARGLDQGVGLDQHDVGGRQAIGLPKGQPDRAGSLLAGGG